MIYHLVLDGVAESALGVGIDVVGSAQRLAASGLCKTAVPAAALQQRVVSLDGQPVRAGSGRLVAADAAFNLRSVRASDVIVVPGVFAATAPLVEALLARDETARVVAQLARAADKGALLAASCSATFVLAATGVLDGARATTTWWLAGAFAQRFAKVALDVDRMLVDGGRAITAGAAFAHADLMLAIVTRLAGPSLARMVAGYLLLDDRPTQSRYMVLEHVRSTDPAVQAAERFVHRNVRRQVSIDELARAAAVSPRTLARRVHAALGVSPNEMVQRIRVTRAAHLLETTTSSVDQVAAEVGYADAAAFRRVFRRISGESPRDRRPTREDSARPDLRARTR